MTDRRKHNLESFTNPEQEREYLIEIELPEFTCLCPVTGQPDFAHITIRYVPDEYCVELKSLKLYIWSYRESRSYHEAVSNQILDDIVKAINPRYAKLVAKFNVRGGAYPTIICTHLAKNWTSSTETKFLNL